MSNLRVSRIRRQTKLSRRVWRRVSRSTAFLFLFIFLATALYSGSSASTFLAIRNSLSASDASGDKAARRKHNAASEIGNLSNPSAHAAVLTDATAAMLLVQGIVPPPPAVPSDTVTTYAVNADGVTCGAPKSAFVFGEKVCAKIEGSDPLSIAARRFSWVSPDNVIQRSTNMTSLPQTDIYTIPAPDPNKDYRGEWRINSINSRSAVRASAFFTVSDPQQITANLSVYDALNTANVSTGSDIEFVLYVINRGPDAAQGVQLTSVGTNSTFASAQVESGAGFTCDSNGTCTIATLAPGTKTRISVHFTPNGNATVGTVITNTATITSTTNDARTDDNTSTAKAVITVESDDSACTLVCPSDISAVANTTQSSARGAIVKFDVEVNGDCGSVTASPASGSFFPVGNTPVTITSASGNSCTFNIKVTDTDKPTISCPANVEKAAGSDCAATVTALELGAATATGGSGQVTIDANRSDGVDLDAPYPLGTTTITWTATDEIGRTDSCTQTVNVTGSDTTPPTITAPPDVTDYTGIDGATCGKIIGESQLGTAATDDNCSGAVDIIRTGIPSGNFFPIGETIITYKARDKAGNLSQPVTQKVIIIDNTPPVIFAPANASYTCPSEVPAGSASQATGPDVEINGVPQPGPPADNCGTPLVTVLDTTSGAGSASSPLIIARTFTATDSHGNSASAVQTITVTDATPPTITGPAAAAVTLYTGPNATSCSVTLTDLDASLGTATASDNCAGVSVARSGVPANNAFPVGTTTVTYTATDWAGNTASTNQVVTVVDNTKPVITVPAPITVNLPLNSTATSMPVSFTVTATDNCGAGLSPTVTPASGSIFPVGTTTVTATATDAAGNTTTSTFTVTVHYNFTGFFQPVDNLPVLNQVNAGRAIPVKFSLSGNKGLNIFAPNSPGSGVISCNANDPVIDVEETVTAGGSSLSYSAGDQYHYVWKTESSWAGTCRQLVIQLNDGSIYRANFKFK